MFFPMLAIMTDYMGDFVRLFPWIITIALAASLFYAVCVVPSLEVKFIKSGDSEKKNKFAIIQEKFIKLSGYHNNSNDY